MTEGKSEKRIQKDNIKNICALTPLQHGMFFHYLSNPHNPAYFQQLSINLQGRISLPAMRKAWQFVIENNEMLRTVFRWEKIKSPVQIVLKEIDPPLAAIDLSIVPEAEKDSILKEERDEQKVFKLKLDQNPFQITLLRLNDTNCEMIIRYHHILFDGWSSGILVKEFLAAYDQFYKNKIPRKRIKTSFNEFVKLQQNRNKETQKLFWSNYFKGFSEKTRIPLEKSTQKISGHKNHHFSLSKQVTAKINQFTKNLEVTVAAFFYTVWAILLQKINQSTDVVFGITLSGRTPELDGIEEMIGLFINSIPLRMQTEPAEKVSSLIKKVMAELNDQKEFELTPLSDIHSYSGLDSAGSLFNSLIVLENYPIDKNTTKSDNLEIIDFEITESTNYDITLGIIEKESFTFELSYKTELYSDKAINRLSSHFIKIIESVLENKDIQVETISLITKEEENEILNVFNKPVSGGQNFLPVQILFEQQVSKDGEKTALIHHQQKITYRELNHQANKYAHFLLSLGVSPEDKITLLINRGFELIIAILAILKARAAYIPLDISSSRERNEKIIKDSGSTILITQKSCNSIPDFNGKTIFLEDKHADNCPDTNPEFRSLPDDLVYMIYTSGSTGIPKGVMVTHKNLYTYNQAFQAEFQLTNKDSVLQQAPASFDQFVEELYPTLLTGGTVVIADKMEILDLKKLTSIIVDYNITFVTCQPLLLNELNKTDRLINVRYFLSGADVLKKEYISNLFTTAKVYNTYGPTEATVCGTYYQCNPASTKDSIPIGKPILNYRLYILNDQMQLQPIGTPGQIYISGPGVTRGYWNNRKLTEKHFKPDPFAVNLMMYGTGDLGYWHSDGTIEFLGRCDEQIQIRGFRVEPGEIEYHLMQYAGIETAVVLSVNSRENNTSLNAYITLNGNIDIDVLKEFLIDRIPDYMIPSYFYQVDTIPLTTHSKIDKEKLLKCQNLLNQATIDLQPKDEFEKSITEIWQNILKTTNISLDQPFFNCGGNSLTVMQLHSALEKKYDTEIAVAELFVETTIINQAHLIKSKLESKPQIKKEKINDEEHLKEDVIAVIGIAFKLPSADTIDDLTAILRNGTDCVRPIPEKRQRLADNYFNFIGKNPQEVKYEEAAYLEDIDLFDNDFFTISPNEAKLMDPNQRIFLQTVWNTFEDAGYSGDEIKGSKTGIYVGYGSDSDYMNMIRQFEPESAPIALPGNLKPVIASRISFLLDLHGPAMIVDTTCSSSLVAVHLACQAIRNGDCEMAIAGGSQIHMIPQREFLLGIESLSNRSRSFDEDADGTGTGEGVAAVLLKPLLKAQKEGDHIYGVIRSSAVNQDGSSIGLTAPNAKAQEEVIFNAWQKAQIDPNTISYIEAHGTGTKLGDPIEIEGMQRAFKRVTNKTNFCAVSSIKSNMGHLDNTAGILGLLKALISIKNKELYPSVHFKKLNKKIKSLNSPIYINSKLKQWDKVQKRRCGISSFGLSGTNCHIILEEAPLKNRCRKENPQQIELFTLSAKSKEVLHEYIQKYIQFLQKETIPSIEDLCCTASLGRNHFAYRIAILVKSGSELLLHLENFIKSEKLTVNQAPLYISENMMSNSLTRQKHYPNNVIQQSPLNIDKMVQDFPNRENFLTELGLQYCRGNTINWNTFYKEGKRNRVSLPCYPFAKKRFWLNFPQYQREVTPESLSPPFYCNKWLHHPLQVEDEMATANQAEVILLTKPNNDLVNKFALKYENNKLKPIIITLGNQFQRVNKKNWEITGLKEDYFTVFNEIQFKDSVKIVHLLSIDLQNTEKENYSISLEIKSLLYLIQAIHYHKISIPIEIILVSDFVHAVGKGEGKINTHNTLLFGLGKSIGWEYKNITIRCLDIDNKTEDGNYFKELNISSNEYITAYRNGKRYVQRLGKIQINQNGNNILRHNGTYLITGGLGGIGLEIAGFLAREKSVQLAFINRSEFPDREEWGKIIDLNQEKDVINKIELIKKIEQNGSVINCYQTDITDKDSLSQIIERIKNDFGNINGVIHSAGISEGARTGEMSEVLLERVLAPKMKGTLFLDELTRNENIDFFILNSSAITLMGGLGGSAYTAANTFLNAFARERSLFNKKTIAINWPTWYDTGMASGETEDNSQELFFLLTSRKAFAAFNLLLNSNNGISEIYVGDINEQSSLLTINERLPFKFSESLKKEFLDKRKNYQKSNIQFIETKFSGNENQSYTNMEKTIASVWARILGLNDINIYDDFFELGGNSIMAIQIEVELEKSSVFCSSELLYQYPTIATLSAFLSSESSSSDDEKIISGIEPFNEIFYKSCFYNSVFPVIRSFNKSILPFLLNDLIVYKKEPEQADFPFKICYEEAEKCEELFQQVDIKVNSFKHEKKITEEIINSINLNCPVVLWIDTFYLPVRKDTYKKAHLNHTILVYGYNKGKNIFYIVEHERQENLSYKKMNISFNELEQAYNGYLFHYQKDSEQSSGFILMDTKSTGIKREDSILKFETYYNESKNKNINSLKNLDDFVVFFKDITSSEELFKSNVEKLVHFLNEIINAKHMEKYRLKMIVKETDQINDVIATLISSWEIIRKGVARFLYLPLYDKRKINKLFDKLVEIKKLEENFIIGMSRKTD